jgi:hypothetical protein
VALAAYLEGDLGVASREIADAITGSRAVEAAEDTWHALTTEGDVLSAQGDAAGAKQAYADAADLAAHAGDADANAEIEVAQAMWMLDAGDAAQAASLARAALDRFTAAKFAHDQALARAMLVRALVAQGDADGASRELVVLEQAVPTCQLFRARFLAGIASSELAALRRDPEAASRFAGEARTMAEGAGMVPLVFEARWVEAKVARVTLRGTLMARLAKDARAAGFVRVAELARR